jgi:hypothetical protein
MPLTFWNHPRLGAPLSSLPGSFLLSPPDFSGLHAAQRFASAFSDFAADCFLPALGSFAASLPWPWQV